MRRLFAIALLLFFNVPLISPLFAITAGSDVNLPACCRRHGAHHCNAQMAQPASNDPSFTSVPERCPFYPRPATLVRITHAQAQPEAHNATASVALTHLTPPAETHSKAAFTSPCQKRGPPAQQA